MICGLEAIRRARYANVRQAHHWIMTSDTKTENGSVRQQLLRMFDEVQAYIDKHDLPVSILTVEPSLPDQFVVATLGRGSLARTPQNSVKNGKAKRPCSESWKAIPQERAQKKIAQESVLLGFREPVAALGTRLDESISRGTRMTERGDNAFTPVRNKRGMLTYAPIADWTVDDVWTLLTEFMDEKDNPFPPAVSAYTVKLLDQLYKDGNDGTCGVVLGDGGYRKPCSARFGCWNCLMVGERDPSMESMVKESRHAHMAGLNRLRNYIAAMQNDLARRELIGRTRSAAGYLAVSADVLNFHTRMELLKMMLTLDKLEQERAEAMEEAIACGEVEATEENRALAEVQFEIINFSQLVAIDWFLSMHPFCPHAMPAISAWYEVHHLGRRVYVPENPPVIPKQPVELHGWFKVGNYDDQVPTWGLYSHEVERWNAYRHPDRVSAYAQAGEGLKTVYFEEADQMKVDAEQACMYVTCMFDFQMYQEVQGLDAIEGARFWINETILKPATGMMGRYQHMAVRGQYFAHLAQKLNLSPADMDDYIKKNAISDAEHNLLLAATDMPLFGNEGLPEVDGEDEEEKEFNLAELLL